MYNRSVGLSVKSETHILMHTTLRIDLKGYGLAGSAYEVDMGHDGTNDLAASDCISIDLVAFEAIGGQILDPYQRGT